MLASSSFFPGSSGSGERLRSWCDRLLFPLHGQAGQGFTGRALALWQPGMDEHEHKMLLEAQKIPRWKTTGVTGFFHAAILDVETIEHITLVEGLFDALAVLAVGIEDVIATCGTSIALDTTLAYDGDQAGQKAAANGSRLLSRAGIATRRVLPPDDGQGKDWSERYRLQGAAGLEPLVQERQRHVQALAGAQSTGAGAGSEVSELAQAGEDLADRCADCHASIEEERGFFYWALSEDRAVLYCEVCRDPETG